MSDHQSQAVLERSKQITKATATLPLDEITATAFIFTAALMVRVGSEEVSREQWLASCASCFDAVASAKPL